MSENRKPIRQRLLDMEQVTPALRERYETEMKTMLEQPITGYRKVAWVFSTGLGVFFIILFGFLAITLPSEFPLVGRISFAVGAVFGLGWTILGIAVLRRGVFHLKIHGWAIAGIVWVATLLWTTLCMMGAPEGLVGLRMILFCLPFLLIAAMFMIQQTIQRSELKTRERLLEIEHRLIELAGRRADDSQPEP